MDNSFQDDRIAYCDTLNSSHDRLFRLLQLIDYSNGLIFLNIRTEIQPVIISALQKANVEIVYEYKQLLYYLSKEEALKLDVRSELHRTENE